MIKITDVMRRLIDSAGEDDVPCLVGTASADGRPQISPKGSLAVYDDESLCYWERSFRSSEKRLRENQKVVVYYRNPRRVAEAGNRAGAFRFHGTARMVTQGTELDRVWELTPAREKENHPDKAKGAAVLIRVDLVEELSGKILMQRE